MAESFGAEQPMACIPRVGIQVLNAISAPEAYDETRIRQWHKFVVIDDDGIPGGAAW